MALCYKCDACGSTFEKPGFLGISKVDTIYFYKEGIDESSFGGLVRKLNVCPECLDKVASVLYGHKEK